MNREERAFPCPRGVSEIRYPTPPYLYNIGGRIRIGLFNRIPVFLGFWGIPKVTIRERLEKEEFIAPHHPMQRALIGSAIVVIAEYPLQFTRCYHTTWQPVENQVTDLFSKLILLDASSPLVSASLMV